MLKEGTVQQIEAVEKCLLNMGKEYVECMHDGSRDTEKLFADQQGSKVFYKLYEVYTRPITDNFFSLTVTPSSIIRLWFDYRDGTGLLETNDRDWARLWGLMNLRTVLRQIGTNGK